MTFHTELRAVLLALSLAVAMGSAANGQLRIVNYNTAGVSNSSAMQTVLTAMANETVNGVVKPIDAIILQELGSGDIGAITSILNGLNMGTYVASNVGGTTGAGGVGLVYRTQSLDLIAQQQIIAPNTNGAERGVMRFILRPDGYDDAANFYIYNSHYKASDSASDRTQRNREATAIRANADALGQGAHIIYAGDFNIYRSSEPMWATLTRAGNGQAFDPVNQVGNWHDTAAFRGVHTQNPAGSGFVGGGMDDRFDWQMVSGELLDGEGMAIMAGSYHAFGNNGTHAINGHINTGSGASAAVLNALGAASDHLPVVAQYQVPAKMSVAVSSVPAQVLVGASLAATVSVSNTAGDGSIVVAPDGADELDYTVTATGAANGSVNGTDEAFGASNQHSFVLDTATAGAKSASFTVGTTSPQVPDPSRMESRNYSVFDHATPSFAGDLAVTTLFHDLGSVLIGSESPVFGIELFNLIGTPGFTAALDFDSVLATGDTTALVASFAEAGEGLTIGAGSHHDFSAMLDTSTVGTFAATYILTLSDEDLPGALSQLLTLSLTGEVTSAVLPGDFNDDGAVDAADYVVWREGLDTLYTQDDYHEWAANFGRSDGVVDGSFVVAVPEPAAFSLLIAVAVVALCRFRHRLPARDGSSMQSATGQQWTRRLNSI